MTKTKAFLICFITPLVAIWLARLVAVLNAEKIYYSPNVTRSISESSFFLPWLLSGLMILAFIVPALTLRREFRLYGFYGALVLAFVIAVTFLVVVK